MKPNAVEVVFALQAAGDVPDAGLQFLHCATCCAERPDGVSQRAWARLSVALTSKNVIQVWCVRHDGNVAVIEAVNVPVGGH